MIKDTINDILNIPRNSYGERYDELVNLYFNTSINIDYIEMVVGQNEIIYKSSHYSKEVSNNTDSDIYQLFNIIKEYNGKICGSEITIYRNKFLELWKMFFSQNADVLIVPCYIANSILYSVCIRDFKILEKEYNMKNLNLENTILDEFPVLFFILKHSLYNYYFDHTDSTWRFIIGCGNMTQTVKIINNIFQNYYIPGLELYQELANMPYEGIANFGVIDFIDKYEEDIGKCEIEFIDKCVLYKNQGRVLRKYLQMASVDRHLIAVRYNAIDYTNQCWIVEGINTLPKEEILCTMKFQGNSKWSCEFKNETILYNGTEYELYINSRTTSSNQYVSVISEIFGEDACNNIIKVINNIKKQTHGTMLIISEDAHLEAVRLGKIHRAIRVQSVNMLAQNSQMLLALSSIDGAILMDVNCICYSIGTILDGYAEVYSNLGRGARFNSAFSYIYNMKMNDRKSAAVVISEDGMVDVITTANVENIENDLYRYIEENEQMLIDSMISEYYNSEEYE